jgi:hypothetical protein
MKFVHLQEDYHIYIQTVQRKYTFSSDFKAETDAKQYNIVNCSLIHYPSNYNEVILPPTYVCQVHKI